MSNYGEPSLDPMDRVNSLTNLIDAIRAEHESELPAGQEIVADAAYVARVVQQALREAKGWDEALFAEKPATLSEAVAAWGKSHDFQEKFKALLCVDAFTKADLGGHVTFEDFFREALV